MSHTLSLSVQRTVLASIETPYAVTLDATGGQLSAYAASEMKHGSSMMFRAPEWKPIPIASRPGGCMGVVPLQRMGLPGVLMIEDFFPIFQSDKSGAAHYTPPADGSMTWNRRRLFDVPFLHRVAIVESHGRPVVIASQLCRSKDSIDEWSQAGALYQVHPGGSDERWSVCETPLLDGLHRNHGLYTQEQEDGVRIYAAADEGIFLLRQPLPTRPWIVEQVIDTPTSDLWKCDLDGDGIDEIITIHPFHGETARIYKRFGNTWETVWEEHGAFGHVVWAGKLRGQVCVMLGWREATRNLDLHFLEDAFTWRFRRETLDADVAPLNAAVHHTPDADYILASHGTTHEVVLYTFR